MSQMTFQASVSFELLATLATFIFFGSTCSVSFSVDQISPQQPSCHCCHLLVF